MELALSLRGGFWGQPCRIPAEHVSRKAADEDLSASGDRKQVPGAFHRAQNFAGFRVNLHHRTFAFTMVAARGSTSSPTSKLG